MDITTESNSAYDRLCDITRGHGGTVRLAHNAADSWILVVTLPREDGLPSVAAGFAFNDLAELTPAAGLLLAWLDNVFWSPPTEGRAQ